MVLWLFGYKGCGSSILTAWQEAASFWRAHHCCFLLLHAQAFQALPATNREYGGLSLPTVHSLQSLVVFFLLPCIDTSFTLLLVLDHQQPGHCSCLYFKLKWVASFLLATGCLAFFLFPSIKSDKCSFTEQCNQRSHSKRADSKLCAGCKLFYPGIA